MALAFSDARKRCRGCTARSGWGAGGPGDRRAYGYVANRPFLSSPIRRIVTGASHVDAWAPGRSSSPPAATAPHPLCLRFDVVALPMCPLQAEATVHTGQGTLIFRDGLRLSVTYRFGSDYDDRRAGYLLCDTSKLDPLALCDRLRLIWNDGTEVIIAVLHSSDRHLGVIGRALPKSAPSAN